MCWESLSQKRKKAISLQFFKGDTSGLSIHWQKDNLCSTRKINKESLAMVDGRRMCKKHDKAGIKSRFIAIRLSTKYCLYLCDIYSILEHHHRIATIPARSSLLPLLHFHVITLHNRTNAPCEADGDEMLVKKKMLEPFFWLPFFTLYERNKKKRKEAFDVSFVKVSHKKKNKKASVAVAATSTQKSLKMKIPLRAINNPP